MNVNLVLFKKSGESKNFTLPSAVTVVGRRQDCDLCVPLMVVSRRHCELNQDQGQLRLRDLGSRNGTFVNGRRVEETQLNPGDEIQIGPVKFGVQIDGEPTKLKISDSAIIQPPEHIAEFEQDSAANEEKPKGTRDDALNEVDMSQSHPTEIFDILNEEHNGGEEQV
jgi:pSer/pThr/pTyr-binding forkhead associated (FHA) protein